MKKECFLVKNNLDNPVSITRLCQDYEEMSQDKYTLT